MVWQRNNQKGGAQNGFFFIFAEMVYPKEHAIFPNDITQPRVPNENQSFTSRIPPLQSEIRAWSHWFDEKIVLKSGNTEFGPMPG